MHNWGPSDHVRAVVADRSAHPDRLLGAIAMLAAARECLDDAEADLVTRARAEGLTWREIAAAMSLGSPQAAAQRAHRRPPRRDDVPEQPSRRRCDDGLGRIGQPGPGEHRAGTYVHRASLHGSQDDEKAR